MQDPFSSWPELRLGHTTAVGHAQAVRQLDLDPKRGGLRSATNSLLMTGGSSFPPRALGGRNQWVGRPTILGWAGHSVPQWARYLVLTVSFLGLQLVWSCEMAQASPYLLSLGVSKSMMSIVFLAGPLSGLIVQPVVGVMSDSCKSSLGRRRPFIIGGCALTATAVLLLGFSSNLAAVVFEDGGTAVSPSWGTAQTSTS